MEASVLPKAVEDIRNGAVKLDLVDMRIGDAGAMDIANALVGNTTLKALNLNDNQIGVEGAKAIGAALSKNDTLEKLWLGCNRIGGEGAKAIGAALENDSRLQTLDLGGNQIGAEGAEAIGAALEKNTSLQTLQLEDNQIGAQGAKAIGAALKEKNTTLQTLVFWSNNIGAEGAKAMGAALEKNCTLQTLKLGNNIIGDEGAKAIGAALEKNETLQVLEMGSHSFGDEGIKSLGAALAQNKALQTFDFYYVLIGKEGAKALAAGLESNHALTSFTCAIFDEPYRSQINAALTRNKDLKLQDVGVGSEDLVAPFGRLAVETPTTVPSASSEHASHPASATSAPQAHSRPTTSRATMMYNELTGFELSGDNLAVLFHDTLQDNARFIMASGLRANFADDPNYDYELAHKDGGAPKVVFFCCKTEADVLPMTVQYPRNASSGAAIARVIVPCDTLLSAELDMFFVGFKRPSEKGHTVQIHVLFIEKQHACHQFCVDKFHQIIPDKNPLFFKSDSGEWRHVRTIGTRTVYANICYAGDVPSGHCRIIQKLVKKASS